MYNDSLPSAVDGAEGELRETGHSTGSGRASSSGARARKQPHWRPKFASSWRNAFSGARSSNRGTKSTKSTTKSITPLLLLLALATLSTRLFSLPLNRVIESRYCAAYYHSSPSQPPPPEEQCKIDWVQRRLAWLQGVIETAVIGVDLGVAVPAAWVGDRWKERGRGRRVVLAANLLGWAGVVLWVVIVGHLDGVLPVSAMAAAPFFALIGGHDCVLNSAVFAIVTDLTDDLVQRTSYIAYVTSVNYVVSLFGPSLASAAMTVNLWLPFYLSIAFLIAALPVVYFLPLDNGQSHASSANKASSSSTAANRDDEDDDDIEAAPLLRTASSSSPPSLPLPLKARLTQLIQQRPRFLLLLASFLLTSLASSNTHLLPQYMSARYQRSFASVGPLLSLKAATNIVLLTLVVPVGMQLDRRDRDESEDRDGGSGRAKANTHTHTHTSQTIALNIDAALLSLLISVFGALCIAAAPTVPFLVAALLLYALGSALPVFTMALVDAVDHDDDDDDDDGTAPRERRCGRPRGAAAGGEQDAASSASPTRRVSHNNNHSSSSSSATARVYTVVMVVKTVGSLVGAPLMTAVWVAGIGVGGAGLGMPFWVSAALYLCAMGVIWCLKL
ncbi:major facilitator superfamily domain-containing protein [Phyllosticta citribraziliensis]